jgi:hypothetical protein
MKLIGWFLSLYFLIGCLPLSAQELGMPPIPPMRMLYHDQINASYETILREHFKSGKSAEDSATIINREGLIRKKIDGFRAAIELDSSFSDNDRYKWLRSLRELLDGYKDLLAAKKIQFAQWPQLIDGYGAAMKATWTGQSYMPVFETLAPETAWLLLQNKALQTNSAHEEAADWLLLQQANRDPSTILPLLSKQPRCRYADSLIIRAAFLDQEKLYTYAAVPNALGKKIHQSTHPLVKLIAYLTKLPTGRMIFPFIDEIYHGRLTIDSIAPFTREDTTGTYFNMLVQTRIAYMKRLHRGDTAMAMDALYKRIRQKAVEDYLNEINGLHEEANPLKRFKKISRLSPEELYYVAITGEEEMYTSSFVAGIYPRMFQLWKGKSSDSLLARVQYDQYRRFIRLCASYNTLDDWLSRMDTATARKMVLDFTDGLERTAGLAEAVDVATTYSSIYNEGIRKWMLAKVDERAQQLKGTGDSRGAAIYSILQKIFYSMDTSRRTSLLDTLGLQPADRLLLSSLQDTSGRIIVQQFFYGDKGGPEIYQTFLRRFTNPNWKIQKKPYWTEVSSVKGVPVTIYSNLPLDEVGDNDEHAQDSLITYLLSKKIEPVMSIHRGHSYSLPSTIEKLPYSSRLVLVGSCGGYQRLHDVLETCPEAAIISSKQVGTGQINQQLIDVICEQLRQGKDIYWPALWKKMEAGLAGKSLETFRDYVPPYQNLGALFIQAYRTMMDKGPSGRSF